MCATPPWLWPRPLELDLGKNQTKLKSDGRERNGVDDTARPHIASLKGSFPRFP